MKGRFTLVVKQKGEYHRVATPHNLKQMFDVDRFLRAAEDWRM
jgi:hypothetical protein